MLNGLDLFSGIGGLTIALSQVVCPIAYCEKDRYACAVLLSRMRDGSIPSAPIWDDVRTLSGGMVPRPIDIIYGGFPCQDISTAGNGSLIAKGLDGKRSVLVFEVFRLVDELNPSFVFLENVPAIRTRGAERVGKELAERGYDCRWTNISAEEVGAKHRRERWFLLAANANSPDLRDEQRWRGWQVWESTSKPGIVSEISDTDGEHGGKGRARPDLRRWDEVSDKFSSYWKKEAEPEMGVLADGIPARVDSLRALGNAVVPLQAREAFKRLMGLE